MRKLSLIEFVLIALIIVVLVAVWQGLGGR
jgi:hypothetical protein